MATRRLTEVYILMRNNSQHSKQILNDGYFDRKSEDRVSLVAKSELGNHAGPLKLPPEWVDKAEEVHYEFSKVKVQMKELANLHDKHMNRPTFDDNVDEEHAIEILTREITSSYHKCHGHIEGIKKGINDYMSSQDASVTKNVVKSLAFELQSLSQDFRTKQSYYLKRLRSREEGSGRFFELGQSSIAGGDVDFEDVVYDRRMNQVQLQAIEENTIDVQEREKDITNIIQSIIDLNSLFRDVSLLVEEQGTVMDRIDYNIDQTGTKVQGGLKKLQKAEKYQKKNRKMLAIIALTLIVVLLIVVLIATKSG